MKTVGLILCRAGSKGVPGKNKKAINGKPLFSYQVGNLKKAGVKDVYVSTDDPDIKILDKQYGFTAIDRPVEISNDTAKCEAALLHFAEIVDFDILAFAQATSPMCPPKYLKAGIRMVENNECDSTVSVVEEHWLPRWDMSMNPQGWETSKRPRRQDRPCLYVENGAFYITKRDCLISSGVRYSGVIKPVVMPLIDSFQVDTYDDFNLIQNLMKK